MKTATDFASASSTDITIAKILYGDGDVSEHSLIGDCTADYNVNYWSKFDYPICIKIFLHFILI
jgi:hypothetical protein